MGMVKVAERDSPEKECLADRGRNILYSCLLNVSMLLHYYLTIINYKPSLWRGASIRLTSQRKDGVLVPPGGFIPHFT
jgi:hypothetical protein